jgi:hypothetical protein
MLNRDLFPRGRIDAPSFFATMPYIGPPGFSLVTSLRSHIPCGASGIAAVREFYSHKIGWLGTLRYMLRSWVLK